MTPTKTNAAPRRRRRATGFTLVELLVVVAIIGIISAIAIPNLLSAMRKSRESALLADAKTLFHGFVAYNLDKDQYPPCCSPPEEALDLATLHPLTTNGYIKAATLTGRLENDQLSLYDSPDSPTANHDFYAVLTWDGDPTLQVLVADTDEYPGHAGDTLYGLYLIEGATLVPVSEK